MARILRFLDEQATPLDIVAIMASLPAPLFVGTALEMAAARVIGFGKAGKRSEAEKGEMVASKPRLV